MPIQSCPRGRELVGIVLDEQLDPRYSVIILMGCTTVALSLFVILCPAEVLYDIKLSCLH